MSSHAKKPVVLCFSGLDSTGGAGIQADIETLFSIGCHCAPVVTALTVQNTQNVISSSPCDPALLIQQSRAVLEDMPVAAFKIGLLGSIEAIEVVHTLLKDYASIPVILDPVLSAGGGFDFSDQDYVEALRNLLLPLTTILTPNTVEARKLAANADNPDACANELFDLGVDHVLVTGTHAQTEAVENRLFSPHQEITQFNWPRLEHSYHGSGCTLAAAIAGYTAHGLSVRDAIQQAQRFTWESLSHGQRAGFGQHLPDRSFWNKHSC